MLTKTNEQRGEISNRLFYYLTSHSGAAGFTVSSATRVGRNHKAKPTNLVYKVTVDLQEPEILGALVITLYTTKIDIRVDPGFPYLDILESLSSWFKEDGDAWRYKYCFHILPPPLKDFPCTHCGSADWIVRRESNERHTWARVECQSCGIRTADESSEDTALNVWYRRPVKAIPTESDELRPIDRPVHVVSEEAREQMRQADKRRGQ